MIMSSLVRLKTCSSAFKKVLASVVVVNAAVVGLTPGANPSTSEFTTTYVQRPRCMK
jgi:hypothetical protein